ncbi:hypothetical protein [Geodermatophilus sp. SYSU D00815]
MRQQPPSAAGRPPAGTGRPLPRRDVRFERNVAQDRPTILGFPAEYDTDDEPAPAPRRDPAGSPVPGVRVVVLRRADPLAAVALVLAGLAAGASLWLPWVDGRDAAGLALVRDGLAEVPSGMAALVAGELWPPLAVVLGGGVLLLLGLLLLRRARTHRLVGVGALLVAGLAVAGVVVLLAGTGWRAARFDAGAWCAVAVAALGLAGALKAVLTTPRVTVERAGR